MRFQKRLLRGMQISPVKRRAAGHPAHREHLQLGPFPAEIGLGLIPIDLRFQPHS